MKKFVVMIASLFLVCGCATSHLENGDESVVKFDEGGISAQDLYELLKDNYGAEAVVTLIDKELLSREYKSTSEENTYVREVIASLKNDWKDNFLTYAKSYYGVNSEDALEDYVRLNYRRNKWKTDYSKTLVNDTQIDEYYEKYVVGDMEISHILVTSKASQDATDDEKKTLEDKAYQDALAIINRINNGEKFEDLSKELNEDTSVKNNGGKLPEKINDRSSYDKNFLEAAINLEVGKYTTKPVKSQFGYHIIYKSSQDKKPELKDIKDDVISVIAEDIVEADSNFSANALLALRKKYDIEITDSELEKAYNKLYSLQ